MGKHVYALLKKLICFILVLSLTGCWNRRELNELGIVMGIGIDKENNKDEVQITTQIAKPGKIKTAKNAGQSESDDKAYWNIKSGGITVFDTLRGATHESSRKLFFPHNYIVIISRSIAEEGVQKYIDFFIRDPEVRIGFYILVSKNKPDEILDVKSELERIPANNISKLLEAQAATSQTAVVKFKDFATSMISKTTAPIAPFAEIVDDRGKKAISVSGTAVFKTGKLAGELDKTETRGLLWVINKIKSGIIVVDCPNGDGKVSLEIIRASSKITPQIEGDKIKIKVDIKEEGNLGEQSCKTNLATPPMFELLNKEQDAAIKNEVMSALKKAKELNTDIFGFGESIHQKYPSQWKNMESRWDELFPDLEVEVNVESKLNLTGRINRPVAPE